MSTSAFAISIFGLDHGLAQSFHGVLSKDVREHRFTIVLSDSVRRAAAVGLPSFAGSRWTLDRLSFTPQVTT